MVYAVNAHDLVATATVADNREGEQACQITVAFLQLTLTNGALSNYTPC